MIERISQKLLDVLQSDSRLTQPGNAYTYGWPGVTREEYGEEAREGYVNLFDKPHDPDATTRRPAIYVGTRGNEGDDRLDFDTHSSEGRIQYRLLTVPLVVCVQANGDNVITAKRQARQQRNQLRNNVMLILLDNILADGYWYELIVPGAHAGGGSTARVSTTATGGNQQQVAEGLAILPCQFRYSFSAAAYA